MGEPGTNDREGLTTEASLKGMWALGVQKVSCINQGEAFKLGLS